MATLIIKSRLYTARRPRTFENKIFRTICGQIRDARMNGEESLIGWTTGGIESGTDYTKIHKETMLTVVGACHENKRKRNHQSSSGVDVGWEEGQAKEEVAWSSEWWWSWNFRGAEVERGCSGSIYVEGYSDVSKYSKRLVEPVKRYANVSTKKVKNSNFWKV